MSAVNRIDYTGVLAFEAILEALKPQTRLCVASGGELESGNQTLTSFKKGDVYEQHVKGIRLHLAHVLPSAHRSEQSYETTTPPFSFSNHMDFLIPQQGTAASRNHQWFTRPW